MTRDGQIDFLAIAHALREEDVDAAINLGLLDWAGDAASAEDAGLDAYGVALLQRVRGERLMALAARDRYRIRNARLQRWQDERRQRQAESVSTPPGGTPALTGAAAAALARALAKAKR